MKRLVILVAFSSVLSGCASMQPGRAYVGKPIAEAVREMGWLESVEDYEGKGRYFTWSTTDIIVMWEGADNPANWLTPVTRMSPSAERMGEAQREALPPWIDSRPFRPSSCRLTLVADWDEARSTWIAKKAIYREPPMGGACSMRKER